MSNVIDPLSAAERITVPRGMSWSAAIARTAKASWFLVRSGSSQGWRLFLTTGVLGGFTTFSTLSLEAALLWERGALLQAVIYVIGSIGLGVIALIAGFALVRQLAPT